MPLSEVLSHQFASASYRRKEETHLLSIDTRLLVTLLVPAHLASFTFQRYLIKFSALAEYFRNGQLCLNNFKQT
jgi:hypothetical protein